jgi:hypothetical protein
MINTQIDFFQSETTRFANISLHAGLDTSRSCLQSTKCSRRILNSWYSCPNCHKYLKVVYFVLIILLRELCFKTERLTCPLFLTFMCMVSFLRTAGNLYQRLEMNTIQYPISGMNGALCGNSTLLYGIGLNI